MFKAPPILLIIFAGMLAGCGNPSGMKVDQLYCNNRIDPIGVENSPKLHWTVIGERNGVEVNSYEIRMAGKVMDQQEIDRYPFEAGKRYDWQVRVADSLGRFSPWSRKAFFVTGMPDSLWKAAEWIGFEELPDSLRLLPGVHGSGNHLGNLAVQRPVVPVFRKIIQMDKPVEEAWLFVTGLGHYALEFDGKDLTDGFLRPGWTRYARTCLYNGFDLARMLTQGRHELRVTAGPGFFNINRERYRKMVVAEGNPMVRAMLVIRFKDGTTETIGSGADWETAPSAITFTSIYGGEDYDARRVNPSWKPALVVNGPGGRMQWEEDYPLQVMQSFRPVKVTRVADTTWVYDFGQNASGIPKIRLSGAAGSGIRLTPGELIDDNGQVTQQASGGPHYYEYVTDGTPGASWAPRFTYYGFRYLSLYGGVPAGEANPARLPVLEEVVLQHTRNSSPAAGSFRCSNELFNRIHSLIDWSVRSNLASVTTDCPHREKLGWLEVTHLMGNSIRYNYDIRNLYAKIVDDMIGAQLDNGLVPDIAPEFVPFEGGFRDSPEWGSSAVILPWYLYHWYADREPMERAYPMMIRYLNYLGSKANGGILSHGLGDWYDLGPASPGESQLTPMALTATSIYYHDLTLLARMANLLGKEADAIRLSDSASFVKRAFLERFYDPARHIVGSGSQTSYAMPLVVGLVPEEDRKRVNENLIQAVERDGYALTAGDVGFHYLIQALLEADAGELIYRINSREDVPGYGFQLKNGATALTESWPALRYVSNNHMMLGHLMEWLHTGIGGIRQDPEVPGFQKIIIEPQTVGDLTWAETSHRCLQGEIWCRWEKSAKGINIAVRIPVGAQAEIRYKGQVLGRTGSGSYRFTSEI